MSLSDYRFSRYFNFALLGKILIKSDNYGSQMKRAGENT